MFPYPVCIPQFFFLKILCYSLPKFTITFPSHFENYIFKFFQKIAIVQPVRRPLTPPVHSSPVPSTSSFNQQSETPQDIANRRNEVVTVTTENQTVTLRGDVQEVVTEIITETYRPSPDREIRVIFQFIYIVYFKLPSFFINNILKYIYTLIYLLFIKISTVNISYSE